MAASIGISVGTGIGLGIGGSVDVGAVILGSVVAASVGISVDIGPGLGTGGSVDAGVIIVGVERRTGATVGPPQDAKARVDTAMKGTKMIEQSRTIKD